MKTLRIIILILIGLFIVWSFYIDSLGKEETKMIELNADNFQKEVLESDKLIIIDFWAEWCKYCKTLDLTIERLIVFNQKYNRNKIKWFKVDVDKSKRKFLNNFRPFRGLPIVVFYKDGKEIHRFIGILPFITIQKKIKLFLKEEKKEKKDKDNCSGGTCQPSPGY
jgi:thioredoxin 1